MAPADIITLTKACQKSITELFRHVHNLPEIHDWLEVQAARLNLWATNLGVFAEDKLSIAHRLSKNESITKMVIQLLRALQGNLDLLYYAVIEKKPVITTPQRNGDISDSSSGSTSDDEDDIAGRQQRRIEDGLSRLTLIAIRIRREGAKRSEAKAAEYEPRGDDGESLIPGFTSYIEVVLRRAFDAVQDSQQSDTLLVDQPGRARETGLKEGQYHIPDYLRERLRRTMLDRWRRICYQRHHAAGLAKAVDSEIVTSEGHQAESTPTLIESKVNRDTSKSPETNSKQKQSVAAGRAPKTAATETPADLVIDEKADILPKAPGTMTTTVRAGGLSYPPAPEVKRGTEHFACPFCGLLQSTALLQRRKWQSHVMQDLWPYICIFKDCRQPHKTFSTSDDWLQHLKDEHSPNTWSCNLCPRSTHVLFKDSDSYESHLKEQHAEGGMTAQKVSLLIDLACQRVLPKYPHCLFCGFEPEAWQDEPESDEFQKEVVAHMCKQHMETFALDSMPWDIPGADGDSDYRLTHESHTDSASAKRSIMEDQDLMLQYALDKYEQQELANDPSLRRYLQPDSSQGAASFIDIKNWTRTASDAGDLQTKLQETVELWLTTIDQEPDANDLDHPNALAARQAEEFRKIIDWLSPADPWVNHLAARQIDEPQTGDWLLSSHVYQDWKRGSIRHLWIHGKAGCGKTVLCSTAIEDMRMFCDYEHQVNTALAVFYFTFSDSQKQGWNDLLRSLVAQLGWKGPVRLMLQQAYDKPNRGMLGVDELEAISLACLGPYNEVFLLLDALDESPEESNVRYSVLDGLERLSQKASNLNILVTSRETVDIRALMAKLGAQPIPVEARCVDADIRLYVADQLSSDPRLSRLDPRMKSLIEETISDKSNGMFRWAYCQLQELKQLKSTRRTNIEQALRSLPPTLDEIYDRMLIGIEESCKSDALALLRFLAYAQSPLTLGALAGVTTVDPESESVHIDDRRSLEDPLDILSGLASIQGSEEDNDDDPRTITDAESKWPETPNAEAEHTGRRQPIRGTTKISLAHFSIQEYLESERVLHGAAKYFHFKPAREHGILSRSSLIYLMQYSSSDEKTSTVEDFTTFPLLQYAAESWYFHAALHESDDVAAIALEARFLSTERVLRDWLVVHQPDCVSIPFETPGDTGSGLYYAAFAGLEAVVRELLVEGADVNAQGGEYGNALQAASAGGHNEAVRTLIGAGADVNAQGGHYGHALQAASAGGHDVTVQTLLGAGADVNAQGGHYGNALQAASARGHEKVFGMLVDAGADVHAYADAIPAASAGGPPESSKAVHMVMGAGADRH